MQRADERCDCCCDARCFPVLLSRMQYSGWTRNLSRHQLSPGVEVQTPGDPDDCPLARTCYRCWSGARL